MGTLVGSAVGGSVGEALGTSVGGADGTRLGVGVSSRDVSGAVVGSRLGGLVGRMLGVSVGVSVGWADGFAVGTWVPPWLPGGGLNEGLKLGVTLGTSVGGAVGVTDGCSLGAGVVCSLLPLLPLQPGGAACPWKRNAMSGYAQGSVRIPRSVTFPGKNLCTPMYFTIIGTPSVYAPEKIAARQTEEWKLKPQRSPYTGPGLVSQRRGQWMRAPCA